MLVLGSVAALLQVASAKTEVTDQLLRHPAIMPLLIVMAATVGFVIQEGRARATHPEPIHEE